MVNTIKSFRHPGIWGHHCHHLPGRADGQSINRGCRMKKEAGARRGQHADVTYWQPHQTSPELPLATKQSSLQCSMNPLLPRLPSLPRGRPHPLLLPLTPSLPSFTTFSLLRPFHSFLLCFLAHLCPARRQPGLMLERRATGPQLPTQGCVHTCSL